MLNQAFILAGGLGTRLGKLTRDIPKPLLDVSGQPFLEYVLWNLRRHGIYRVVLSVGYLAEEVITVLGDGSRLKLEITYVIEEEPLGTGGALNLARDYLDETFLTLNGDTLFDVNYLDLALGLSSENDAVLALRRVPDVSRYGQVLLNQGKIQSFNEKDTNGTGLISGGVYVLRKKLLDDLPAGYCSIEQDLFPRLVESRSVGGRIYEGFFLDIGLPETYISAQTLLPKWKKKPCAFFDRDGVLNIDSGYVHNIIGFRWIDGAKEAVKLLNDNGFLVILVTNQAGIARGYYAETDFWVLTNWIQNSLAEVGAHLDGVYFCPHHPTMGKGDLRLNCRCRKPQPGMIEQAMAEWAIDMENSFVIGDSAKDMELAESVNLPGYHFNGRNLYEFVEALFADSI